MAKSDLSSYEPVTFAWTESKDTLGAPVLTPVGGSNVIDIFNKYDWTITPTPGRQLIPKITLTEYRQTQSSELRGYLYSARGRASNLAIAGNVGAEPAQGFIAAAGTVATGIVDTLTSSDSSIANTTKAAITKGVAVSTEGLDKLQKNEFTKKLPEGLQKALESYNGLYAVEPTGFVYVLPYYSASNMVTVGNTWSAPGDDFAQGAGQAGSGVGGLIKSLTGNSITEAAPAGGADGSGGAGGAGGGVGGKIIGAIGGAAAGAMDMAEGVAKMAIASTAGAMVKEEIKAFKGTGAVETAGVDFYLYNTLEHGDDVSAIKKNWEFCYLITYQNLPNRKGINYLDAPSLYKVDVSGYKSLPLAYVSKISISNVGNVRLIDMSTGDAATHGESGADIKMIPEAYKISLEFTGVLLNTRNTFLFNADPGAGINITVSNTEIVS